MSKATDTPAAQPDPDAIALESFIATLVKKTGKKRAAIVAALGENGDWLATRVAALLEARRQGATRELSADDAPMFLSMAERGYNRAALVRVLIERRRNAVKQMQLTLLSQAAAESDEPTADERAIAASMSTRGYGSAAALEKRIVENRKRRKP